jgi:putative transposase
VRPAPSLICEFIAENKDVHGIAPIHRALQELGWDIAPRTFHAWKKRAPSKRALSDIVLTEYLTGIYVPDQEGNRPPECLYGATKMWAHMNRQGIQVARCTVERLMRSQSWEGASRKRSHRTTVCDPDHERAPDLVDRHFTVEAPNKLLVTDFTYVRTGGKFAYTAFVIDAFHNRIIGWECSLTKTPDFICRALTQAAELRNREGRPLNLKTIYHSDAGSPSPPTATAVGGAPTSEALAKVIKLRGLQPSIGTVGDAYDNALAETIIGLYKHECIKDGSPFKKSPITTIEKLEEMTSP